MESTIIITNCNSEINREGWKNQDEVRADIDSKGRAYFRPKKVLSNSDWCVLFSGDYKIKTQ